MPAFVQPTARPRVAPLLAALLTGFLGWPGAQPAPAAPAGGVAVVCVYGGHTGGGIAAVAAARLGKSVALVGQISHVGGLSASGLGITDTGAYPASIGGYAAEFYNQVGALYGVAGPVYWFEPHVAEEAFSNLLQTAGVAVYGNEHLASVIESNQVITQITMTDGTVYAAREYIDATYEGDLMAQAGVTFTWGRESSATYGESAAGVHVNSVQYPCDPYVIAGDAASGLLPLIQTNAPGAPGAGDQQLQCYNFRLCLTQNPTNQIPITAPAGYSEATYELLHRYITAYAAVNGSTPLNRLIDIQTEIPNGKTDINAYADVSTDFIGGNATYATNTDAGRQVIYQAHRDYLTGLLYYLATSSNVPLNVRTNMQSWGYARDEFADHGGWPYLLYVREARRMVSDYVMLQQDAQGGRVADDPVALANYTLDCHPVARLAVNGVATWEGAIGTPVPGPFPVSYRSIIPAVGQCQNLFCTFALSASHVGFAALRLEPVFMMTSQAAGDAAAFALDDAVPVQAVNYPKLAAELTAEGQILQWGGPAVAGTNGIILTVNSTTGVARSGGWSAGSNPGGWPLPSGAYWYDSVSTQGQFVRFTPDLATNGYYDVYLWWVAAGNRATNVPVLVTSPGGLSRVLVNQQIPCTNWLKIASSNYFNAGTGGSVTLTNGLAGGLLSGYAIANAVRFVPLGAVPAGAVPAVAVVASVAQTGEAGAAPARFTLVCLNGAPAAPLTLHYTVGGSAQPGRDYAALPGQVTLAAGLTATNVAVAPTGDDLPSNQLDVVVTLQPAATYSLTTLSNATIQLQDHPVNVWRRANFSPAQLADPAISGDGADPAGDGLPNLLKYALGLNPLASEATPFLPAFQGGDFTVTYSASRLAPDAAIEVSWSTNLTDWVPAGPILPEINVVQTVTNELITLAATNTLPAGYVRFGARRQ